MAHAVVADIDPIQGRSALIQGEPTFNDITEAVSAPVEWKPPLGWYIFLAGSMALTSLLGVSIGWLFWEGTGIWGNNIPVAWAWPIVNFVFWVGIGHAGTLISAVLFLFRQKWRTSINRAAEAMTLFAVACALIFPGIHIGRPWLPYWMMPIPNQMGMWPQFRSPLMWDVFAVSIYGTVSIGVLVCRFDSRSGDHARSIEDQDSENRLRYLCPRLARLVPSVAALREGVSDAGRFGDPSGVVCALGGVV